MKKFFFFTGAPEYFDILRIGIFKKAVEKRKVEFNVINLHEFAEDSYGTIDDYPYGGGAGMVMKPEPVFKAFDRFFSNNPPSFVILPSPKGETLHQKILEEFLKGEVLVFICGRYKGIDERIKSLISHEISLGDYVFSSGELAGLIIVEGIIRLIPGVVGDYDSIREDSFVSGILSPPCYTRPREFRKMKVPEVLVSGNHRRIEEWKKKESIRETLLRKPYLLSNLKIDDTVLKIIKEVYNG